MEENGSHALFIDHIAKEPKTRDDLSNHDLHPSQPARGAKCPTPPEQN